MSWVEDGLKRTLFPSGLSKLLKTVQAGNMGTDFYQAVQAFNVGIPFLPNCEALHMDT